MFLIIIKKRTDDQREARTSNIPDIDLSLNAQHPILPRYKNFPGLSFLICKALSSVLESQTVVLTLIPGPV